MTIEKPAPSPAPTDDDRFEDQDDGECWNCGGEGYVYRCMDEIGCVDPESGCDDCMRRCDICNPKPPRAAPAPDDEPAPAPLFRYWNDEAKPND